VVLVAELSRWGRSTLDLLHTLTELEARRASVIAMSGLAFDLTTPHGRMIATIIAGIADFERELIQERIRSGIAAAKARGKRLGRQKGQRPQFDSRRSKRHAATPNHLCRPQTSWELPVGDKLSWGGTNVQNGSWAERPIVPPRPA
jgi:DNA invertase Pin-like site-specific DNA recombinase